MVNKLFSASFMSTQRIMDCRNYKQTTIIKIDYEYKFINKSAVAR